MSPTLITALGAVVGVIGLAVVLLRHLISYSYLEGKRDQRLDIVEKQQTESASAGKILAGLDSTVVALVRTVEKLDHTVNNLLQGKIEIPNRRRSSEDR